MKKMKNNKWRRILIGVLLTFALLITASLWVLPMTVSAAEGEPTDDSSYSTIYFKNDVGWDKIYAFVWKSQPFSSVQDWPGVEMTLEANEIYFCTLTGDYDMVIFNNGGYDAQTADQNIPTDGRNVYIASSDTWVTQEEAKSVEISEVTFPDANFRTYIAEKIDKDADGLLSPEEIKVVGALGIVNKNISDLTGIEHFTELSTLHAYNNQITTLDLSACTKLRILDLSDNPSLTTLDVSKCAKLEYLMLRNCPAELLNSIDLRVFTELYALNLNGVKLTSLDLSGNAALEELYLENTGLTSLNLGANTKISYFMASGQREITHCGVGYVDMNQFGTVANMTDITGGTLGADGWLTLAEGATQITYQYVTGSGDYKLPVTITLSVVEHAYETKAAQKDATHHYTQWCETCRTGNEESVVAHTIKYDYTTKYTDSQHREYCTDCDYLITEACNYASDCEENCSECRLTTRVFSWEEHTLIYTTYIDGDDDSSNDWHGVRCANCSSLNNASERCYYTFACSETCVCGRANPNLVAHAEQITTESDGTHNKVCTDCEWVIAENIGHNLTYTASGAVITETCDYDGCAHTATATIGMEDTAPYYNGTAYYVPVAYSDGWKGGELTVSYEGKAVDGSDYAVTGPVSVGGVDASISIGGATAKFKYNIQPSYVDVGTVSVVSPTTVYSGTDIADIVLGRTNTTVEGTLTLTAGQYLSTARTEYEWTFTPNDLVNYLAISGNVSITLVEDTLQGIGITTAPTKTEYTYGDSFDRDGMVVMGTYASGRVVDLTDHATVEPTELTVATTEVTITYDGVSAKQAITVNPKVVSNPTIKLRSDSYRYTGQPIEGVVYEVLDGGISIPASEYTVEITNNINVGTATVTIVDVAGGNYVVSGSTTFEIIPADQAELVITDKPVGEICYGDEFVLSVLGGSGSGAVSWAVTEGSAFATVDNTGKVSIIGVGSVTITVTKAGDNNYKETDGSFEIVVGKAQNEWVEAPTIQGWTYGEIGNDPTATPKFGSVGLSSFSYRLKGTLAWNNNPPSDAGIYELRVRVQATDNWEILETTIEFEIKKATPTADLFDFTPPANLDVCDGLAKEATVTVKEAIEGVGSITVKYFKGETQLTGAPTTVGTYTVKIEVAEGANYNATQELTVGTFTFDIIDEATHTGLTLKSNENGTHDKFCTVCEKVFADDATCVYEETVNDAYVASKATCISGTTYYKSCECGHKSNDTFVSGSPDTTNHDWNDTDVCSRCHAVKISEKTFPDANFRNYLIDEYADHARDGIFTQDEIALRTELTTGPRAIRDLTGIEYFTELTELNCHGNWLKSVDLSKNTKLTKVDFGEQAWVININPDATFDLNTLGIDVSKLTLPEGCTVNNGIIKFGAGVFELSGLTYPSGYGDTLFEVLLAIENPHTHASVETFDDCTKQEVCLCGDITKAAKEHDFSGDYLRDEYGHWHECLDCGAAEEKTLHSGEDDGDCTTPVLCVCGRVLQTEVPHQYGDRIARVEATCTSEGFEAHYFCRVCSSYFTSDREKTTKEALILAPDADAHAWDAGVITTPATCVDVGTKTFTCAHNAEHIRTEDVAPVPDAHAFGTDYARNETQHGYACVHCGIWKDVETHTYSAVCDVSCDVCGYARTHAPSHVYELEITEDRYLVPGTTNVYYKSCICGKTGSETFAGAYEKISVALGEDITVYYHIRDNGYENPQMRFTINEYTLTVDGESKGGMYLFAFSGVAPQWIGDIIKAELLVDGEVVETKEYTVIRYLNALLTSSAAELGYSPEKYDAMKTLIYDLIVYGSAAQVYTGHKAHAPVGAGVAGSTFEEITSTDAAGAPVGDTVTFNGMTVYFNNANRLMFRFSATDLDGVTFTVKVNDGEETPIGYVADGEYFIITTDAIKATGFDDIYTVTAYKDGVADATLTYSVKSYVYAKQYGTDSMAELARATYNYGLSAKAFAVAE